MEKQKKNSNIYIKKEKCIFFISLISGSLSFCCSIVLWFILIIIRCFVVRVEFDFGGRLFVVILL